MRFRGLATIFLIVLLFVAGFAVGCGGNDQTDNQQDAGANASGEQGQQSTSGGSGGGTGESKEASETKIALGKVLRVDPEKRRLVLKPARGENMIFKVGPNAQVRLDGREAELADAEKGQQVQLEYTVREGASVPNRARSITLFNNGAGGGGRTG